MAADAHLGSVPGDLDAFLGFLEREAAAAANLVLLGDLFDLWLGPERLQTPAHRRVVDGLRALKARGGRLWYVEGNRDYFLAPALTPDPFDAVASEALDLEVGGVRLRFEHGDRINVEDRNYQRWRRLSRSSAVRRGFAALPTGPAAALAAWLERRFRTTSPEHRVRFPEELCRRWALEAFAAGARRLFLGHFHRPWEWETVVGGRRCRAVVIPAWRETRAGWLYDPERGTDGLSAAPAAASAR